jgi:hypothetical protein
LANISIQTNLASLRLGVRSLFHWEKTVNSHIDIFYLVLIDSPQADVDNVGSLNPQFQISFSGEA